MILIFNNKKPTISKTESLSSLETPSRARGLARTVQSLIYTKSPSTLSKSGWNFGKKAGYRRFGNYRMSDICGRRNPAGGLAAVWPKILAKKTSF